MSYVEGEHMAFYDEERFRSGIEKFLEAVHRSDNSDLLEDMDFEIERELEDPNTAMSMLLTAATKEDKCKCQKCSTLAMLAKVMMVKFAQTMDSVFKESDVSKREEILIKALSVVYGGYPSVVDASNVSIGQQPRDCPFDAGFDKFLADRIARN